MMDKKGLSVLKEKVLDEIIAETEKDALAGRIAREKITSQWIHAQFIKRLCSFVQNTGELSFADLVTKDILHLYSDVDQYCWEMLDAYKKNSLVTPDFITSMEGYYQTAKKEFSTWQKAVHVYEDIRQKLAQGLDEKTFTESIERTLFIIRDAQKKLTLPEYVEEVTEELNILYQTYLEFYQKNTSFPPDKWN